MFARHNRIAGAPRDERDERDARLPTIAIARPPKKECLHAADDDGTIVFDKWDHRGKGYTKKLDGFWKAQDKVWSVSMKFMLLSLPWFCVHGSGIPSPVAMTFCRLM